MIILLFWSLKVVGDETKAGKIIDGEKIQHERDTDNEYKAHVICDNLVPP